jgi:hypothetical protein
MIATTLIAMLIILAMLAGWIGVQTLHRRFSERHPEMGFTTDSAEAGGCGMFCFCKNRLTCPKQKLKSKSPDSPDHL